jgi:hypothetical protein
MPRVINSDAIARTSVTRKVIFFRVAPARQRILAERKLPRRVPLRIPNIPRFIHPPPGQVISVRARTQKQIFVVRPTLLHVVNVAFLQQRSSIERDLLRRTPAAGLLHQHSIHTRTRMPPSLLPDLRVPPEAVLIETHSVHRKQFAGRRIVLTDKSFQLD